jgi:hypothetical protein
MENNIDSLWLELEAVEDQNELRRKIYFDIHSNENRYKSLAIEGPFRLFELLGGDENDAELINWASIYTYDEYLIEKDEEYDEDKAAIWDIAKESSKRAEDLGYWYITGICNLEDGDGHDLRFVIGFTEGEFDEVIDTPYNTGDFPGDQWIEME